MFMQGGRRIYMLIFQNWLYEIPLDLQKNVAEM
jgi:hypothetical protein